MSIITTTSLESNKRIKINFKGGDLSSDAGLLLYRVYLNKKLFHDIVKYTRYSVLFKYTATICRSLSNLFQYLQATFSRFKRQISDKF